MQKSDILIPMYNFLEYDKNYFTTLEVWDYYRDYYNDSANENNFLKQHDSFKTIHLYFLLKIMATSFVNISHF